MKEKLSIGEFARLRNITTETLRHYDRIGLLKPFEVDAKTGYRYYSILQDEKLGTIKELRQLGMSIDEIQIYFDNRNLKQSINILKDKHCKLKNRIKELQHLEESISEKIEHLQDISQVTNFEEIVIKEIKEREIVTFDKQINNDIDLSYAFPELENILKEASPIVGSNRIGFIIKPKNLKSNEYNESVVLFLFIKDKENIDEKYIRRVPKGIYACMYYRGSIWYIENYLRKIFKYIEKVNYSICGEILQIIQIDISVTDQIEESLVEIQVPIKKY